MGLHLVVVVMAMMLVPVMTQFESSPTEYGHIDISRVCRSFGFRERQPNDPATAYYWANVLTHCGPGTVFNIKVCTCVRDTVNVPQQRPFCQRLLDITAGGPLAKESNSLHIKYSGDRTSIFQYNNYICYRAAYYEINYMASNDFGNRLNLRFSVLVRQPSALAGSGSDPLITILSNGDCQENGQTRIEPTFTIRYNPASGTESERYVFVVNGREYTCRMSPSRNTQNRGDSEDNISVYYDNGSLEVSINDNQGGQVSTCQVNSGQNIFAAFSYKLSGTVCPLRIGNPATATGRRGDVCISKLELNRDCAQGI